MPRALTCLVVLSLAPLGCTPKSEAKADAVEAVEVEAEPAASAPKQEAASKSAPIPASHELSDIWSSKDRDVFEMRVAEQAKDPDRRRARRLANRLDSLANARAALQEKWTSSPPDANSAKLVLACLDAEKALQRELPKRIAKAPLAIVQDAEFGLWLASDRAAACERPEVHRRFDESIAAAYPPELSAGLDELRFGLAAGVPIEPIVWENASYAANFPRQPFYELSGHEDRERAIPETVNETLALADYLERESLLKAYERGQAEADLVLLYLRALENREFDLEAHANELISRIDRVWGERSIEAIIPLSTMAMRATLTREGELARALQQEAIERCDLRFGANDLPCAYLRFMMGYVQLNTEQFKEAADTMQRAIEVLSTTQVDMRVTGLAPLYVCRARDKAGLQNEILCLNERTQQEK